MKFKQTSSSPEERKLPLLAPGVAVRATMEIIMKAKRVGMADWSFQAPVVAEVVAEFAKNRRVMLRAPTAAGKTKMAIDLVALHLHIVGRVWFLADKRHLVEQAEAHFAPLAQDMGVEIGVVMAGRESNPSARIQICSIGSLRSKMSTFPAPTFIVWDEAHHLLAKTWRDIADAFPLAKHLGLSATPQRRDGKPLGDFFRHLVLAPPEAELERRGVLSPCRYFAPEGVRLDAIKRKGGEFEKKSMDATMAAKKIVGDAVEHYRRHAIDRTAILFATSLKASRNMVKRFRKAGIAAEHLDGATPTDERTAALARLERGEIRVICNVDVFVEGLNVPSIGAVILMRPTQSLARFLQMVGRGRRVTAEYPDLIVLDHAGNVAMHDLPNAERAWSLTGEEKGGPRRCESAERPRRCPDCGCVHAFAAECSECGRVYAAGDRTLEEVFGCLVEIGPPEGCETMAAFSRKCDVSPATVFRWAARGMPMQEGFVETDAALLWRNKNHKRIPAPKGYATRAAFGRIRKVARDTVKAWIIRGLPTVNGFINIKEGLVWCKDNCRPDAPAGCETKAEFAKRCEVWPAEVGKWVKAGMRTKSGYVIIKSGLVWREKNRPDLAPVPEGCVTRAEFARECKVSESCVDSWVKRDLPMEFRYVKVKLGRAWVKKNVRPRPPNGFARRAAFGRPYCVGHSQVELWIKRGLPTKNGYINISKGRKWVEENVPRYAAR